MDKSNTEHKTMVLTGASRGIGHATVKRFSASGWRVITCSRQPFSKSCPWEAGEDDHIQVDLSDPGDTKRAISEIKTRLAGGVLNALVNNAAISPKGNNGIRLDSLHTDTKLWHEVFQVNFYAPLILASGLVEDLKRGSGAIVNVTSIAGGRVHPFAGSAYATSKAALGALTREMASDFAPLGIRVNSIAPGEISTPILSGDSDEMKSSIPMGRFGEPDEVAAAIHFLCAEGSSYITGGELHINGGQHV